MATVKNPPEYPHLCRAINSELEHTCPGHFRTSDERCKYPCTDYSHTCLGHGVMTDKLAFDLSLYYYAAKQRAIQEDRDRKRHKRPHNASIVPLMEIKLNSLMPENVADRTTYRKRIAMPAPVPIHKGGTAPSENNARQNNRRTYTEQDAARHPAVWYNSQFSTSSSSSSDDKRNTRSYASATANKPPAIESNTVFPRPSRYDVAREKQANITRGRQGQAQHTANTRTQFAKKIAELQNSNPTDRRPPHPRQARTAEIKPARFAQTAGKKPAKQPMDVPAKNGQATPVDQDQSTPAMPANLLTNPFAPVKRKHKPSARQRKRNREIKATAQSPSPLATTQPMEVDLAPSIESTVDELLTDLQNTIISAEEAIEQLGSV